jgi:hypothetical protein
MAFGPTGVIWEGNDGGVWKSHDRRHVAGSTATPPWRSASSTTSSSAPVSFTLERMLGGTQDNGTPERVVQPRALVGPAAGRRRRLQRLRLQRHHQPALHDLRVPDHSTRWTHSARRKGHLRALEQRLHVNWISAARRRPQLGRHASWAAPTASGAPPTPPRPRHLDGGERPTPWARAGRSTPWPSRPAQLQRRSTPGSSTGRCLRDHRRRPPGTTAPSGLPGGQGLRHRRLRLQRAGDRVRLRSFNSSGNRVLQAPRDFGVTWTQR